VNDYKFTGINLPGIGQVGNTNPPTLSTFSHTKSRGARGQALARRLPCRIPRQTLAECFHLFNRFRPTGLCRTAPLWQAASSMNSASRPISLNHRLGLPQTISIFRKQHCDHRIRRVNTGQSTIATLYENETNHGFEASVTGGTHP